MNLLLMSLSAALMIIAIIILRALTIERLPKKTFLVLWWIALLRLLIPFSIPSALSIYSLLTPNLSSVVEQQNFTDISSEVSPEIASEAISSPKVLDPLISDILPVAPHTPSDPFDDSLTDLVPEKPVGTETIPKPEPNISSENSYSNENLSVLPVSFSRSEILLIVWGTGSLLIAGLFAFHYLRGIGEFKMSLPTENPFFSEWLASHKLYRNIKIKQFDRIQTPLTYGIFHPVILLPKETLTQNPSTLDFILTHEYVHIRRFDCVTKLLLTAALCIHWFNPLVWAMYLLFNRDIELSCDETVLHLLGQNKRSDYAMALIDMEEQKSRFGPLYSSFSRNSIEERIRAIMKMKKTSLITIIAAVVLVLSVTVVFATSSKPNISEKNDLSTEISDNIVQDIYDPNLYTDYELYGLKFDTKNNKLYFNGNLVRCFDDKWSGKNQNTHGIGYYEPTGTVDIKALRDDKEKLTGLQQATEQEFSARKIQDPTAALKNPVVKGIDGVYREINFDNYKQYETYGMTYNKNDGQFYYKDEPVRFFYDSGCGNSFTDFYNGKVDVEASRDKDNKLTGLHYSSKEDSERRTKEVKQMDSAVTSTENSDTIFPPVPGSGFSQSQDEESNENLLKQYTAYGVTYNKDTNTWTYQNKPIRTLLDQYSGTIYSSDDGKVNIKVIRDENGVFQKIELLSDRQADQELSENGKIAPKNNQLSQSLSINFGGQKTSPKERFAELEKYGVIFVPSETDSTKGDLYYNGELVKFFADPNPNGNFTFVSETKGSNLSLYTTYYDDGTLEKLHTTTETTLNLYPDGPLRVNECKNLTEYFESFGPYQFNFQPSPVDGKSGNLYMRDGTLISSFYDYRENPCFVFRSQNTSSYSWSVAYDGTSFRMSGGGNTPNLFSFMDKGVVYDKTNQSWSYHGKSIHWFIDGNFAQSIDPDGEINLRATYQDGILQSLEEITAEEGKKLAMERLKPDSFTPPVKETSQIKDINSQRLYYAPEGTEVTCAIPGNVFYSGWKDGYGYCVQIADRLGVIWTYSHLKETSVRYGQTVSAGDKIGSVGRTGSATDFYLGLDVFCNNEMLDIQQLLAE